MGSFYGPLGSLAKAAAAERARKEQVQSKEILDMMDVVELISMIPLNSLRTETEALCGTLEHLAGQLKSSAITFDRAEQLWKSYRPKARELTQELLSFVPNDDPRILVQYREGFGRLIKSSDLIVIDSALSAANGAMYFEQVVTSLRKLVSYAPADVTA